MDGVLRIRALQKHSIVFKDGTATTVNRGREHRNRDSARGLGDLGNRLLEPLCDTMYRLCWDGPVSAQGARDAYWALKAESLDEEVQKFNLSVEALFEKVPGCTVFHEANQVFLCRADSKPSRAPAPAPAPAGAEHVWRGKWRVRKDFDGTKCGEGYLSLKRGDELVRGASEEGWACGTLHGRNGWFPPDYVIPAGVLRVVKKDWAHMDPGYLRLQAGEKLWDAGILEDGWAYGVLSKDYSVGGWYPPDFTQQCGEVSSVPSEVAAPPEVPTVDQVTVSKGDVVELHAGIDEFRGRQGKVVRVNGSDVTVRFKCQGFMGDGFREMRTHVENLNRVPDAAVS